MLTRKHYQAIAGIIANQDPPRTAEQLFKTVWIDGKVYALDNLTIDLAAYFKTDNPNFDRQRFYKAAGTEREVV